MAWEPIVNIPKKGKIDKKEVKKMRLNKIKKITKVRIKKKKMLTYSLRNY